MIFFRATVDSINPDIIEVTESWSSDEVLDAELEIEGFTLFHGDRQIEKEESLSKGWCAAI